MSTSSPQAGVPTGRPTVVYIAGSGRSGSTLLERLLGTLPGFVNVGEVNDVFRRVAAHDELCGCGVAFSACPFWTGVGKRAFGGWRTDLVAEARALQRQVARQRYLPLLLAPRLSDRTYREALGRFADLHARLYTAILEESGARVVVDASKGASQAMAIARGVDMRLIHLVRDARGVSFSWAKADVARPHGDGDRATMHSYRPQGTAARWVFLQGEITAARRLMTSSVLVRYEDLVASPAETVLAAVSGLGLPLDPPVVTAVAGNTVDLPVSHGLSGNPSRFKAGPQRLRLDEQWRRDMTRWDRATTTMIAAGPLARYRYLRDPDPVPAAVAEPPLPTRAPVILGVPDPVAPSSADPSSADPSSADSLPPLTVVIPTRGRPELVRLAIASVVAQDYPGRIDCVVVHDQEEPDNSLSALGRDGRRVEVMLNEGDPGLAGSRNAGLTRVTTEFVASCDDDDTWLPDKARLQMQRLLACPQMLVVGAGIRLLMPQDRVVEWLGPKDVVTQQDLFRSRRKELHSSTLLMRRRAFELAGGYDAALPQSYAEDYEWLLRVAQHGSIGVVRRPLANIKKDGVSWFRERNEVVATALEYLLQAHPEIAASRRGSARIFGQIAFAQASLGERREALRWIARAMRRWPLAPQAALAMFQVATGGDPRRLLKLARLAGRGLS